MIYGGKANGSGGSARYVRELSDFLVSRGHKVKILCRLGKMTSNIEETSRLYHQNVSTFNSKKGLSNLSLFQFLPNPLSTVFGIINVAKDIKSENRNERVILHAHDTASSLLIALFVKRIYKVPVIIHIHGFPTREQKIKMAMLKSPFSNLSKVMAIMWHNVNLSLIRHDSIHLILNNNEVKSFYESCGILPETMKVIPSAINLRRWEAALIPRLEARQYLDLYQPKDCVLIGYIGGLNPGKNVETLISAFGCFLKDYPKTNAKLVIIGDGPMKSILEDLVAKYNIGDYVSFLGNIPDAYRFLNALDIFVLPSLSEGSPFSLIESMAAGKGIIASNIPSISELLTQGKEAVLINPTNVEELKRAVFLLYDNPDLRIRLGKAVSEKAKLYDVDQIYGQIIKIYEKLAQK